MEGLAKSKNVIPDLLACDTAIKAMQKWWFCGKITLKGKFSEFFC